MIKYSHSRLTFDERLKNLFKKYSILKNIEIWKEFYLLIFFSLLFLILIIRLFFLQVINHNYYDDILNSQHVSSSLLKADRWDIYAYDKSWTPVKLTENIMLYNVFVDPKFIWDEVKFIDLLTPIVYKHLCETKWMQQVDITWCIQNIEIYTNKQLLPTKPEFFYFGSGIISTWYYTYDWTWFYAQYNQVLSWFTTWIAYSLIKTRLDQKIEIGIKPKNYIWFFTNISFLKELNNLNLDFVDIQYNNYVYVIPSRISNPTKDWLVLKKLLDRYWYMSYYSDFDKNLYPQENRYVKLLSDANPSIAQMVKDLKLKYYMERTKNNIPILHWLWIESYNMRYYPYGSFMSNVLWFVHKSWTPIYGIEQYFDQLLRWKDWKVIWRASAWIWPVWANEFQIEEVKNWDDVYLTVDIWMQREIENIIRQYNKKFRSDSISVLVFDPLSWQVLASANEPNYDPNNYDNVYSLQALSPEYGYLVDSEDYVDVPIYIKTWWEVNLAKAFERTDLTLQKYISNNIYWPQVLRDKNISMPYEPWSVFKTFTVAIGFDIDEIRPYDFYNDQWFVTVWPWEINNADKKACFGENSFLHAFVFSCNVWMMRIVQKIGKETYYNYLEKLAFGKPTWIELGWEEEWTVEWVTTVSLARFLNNSFWQWLLVTPLQLAAWYAPLVNWWYYVQPTIIAWIYDKQNQLFRPKTREVVRQIFKPETSQLMKDALFEVVEQSPEVWNSAKIEWFALWWKSWTSQISYKWKYQNWNWWTHWSFVWLITKNDVRYIIVVQVRRPRWNIWWWSTAWKVFRDVAKFLIWYNMIEK